MIDKDAQQIVAVGIFLFLLLTGFGACCRIQGVRVLFNNDPVVGGFDLDGDGVAEGADYVIPQQENPTLPTE